MRPQESGSRFERRCVTELRFPDLQVEVPRPGIQPEVVVDVERGEIPLWAPGTTLHWRFNQKSLQRQEGADNMKRRVRSLLRNAIHAWKGAAPVAFMEKDSDWDFEIAILKRRDCDQGGCTLASAFFPESGRQRLLIYPSLFECDRLEQVATMVHELGHVFGLRHYFAKTDPDEKTFPSEIFGKHSRFTIMNYGSESRLTEADKRDLKRLYTAAWSADAIAEIGRPVRLIKAPHMAR